MPRENLSGRCGYCHKRVDKPHAPACPKAKKTKPRRWRDDAQIVEFRSLKEYEDGLTPPGITVNVAELMPAGR